MRAPCGGTATEQPGTFAARLQGECLGWVLLQQGRLGEAAAAYNAVLTEYPNTPWVLTGLKDVHAALAALPEDQAKGARAPRGVLCHPGPRRSWNVLALSLRGGPRAHRHRVSDGSK